MWRDDDDKILNILDDLYAEKERFPVICPVCGKRDGHAYLHKHNENSQRGGLWLWCSACRHTSHSSYQLPLWWKNLDSLNTAKLASFPDYLEEHKTDIDKWVNKLKGFE